MLFLFNKSTDSLNTLTGIHINSSCLQRLNSAQPGLKKGKEDSMNEIYVRISSGKKK